MREDIISAGIDIGTSTTQLVFSRITIENTASCFAVPRISIVDKQLIYESEIYFTPLKSLKEIDGEKVRSIVEAEYKRAGILPSEVKTGAVIITGETARKENAGEVLQSLSGLAGDFVVATAGPDLESIIAGKGAGADVLSEEKMCTVANLDIGGGTTNISVFQNGRLVGTTCLDIGGRLIKIENKRVTYIFSTIKEYIAQQGISLKEGDVADERVLSQITNWMACVLDQSVNLSVSEAFFSKMFTNEGKPLKSDLKIQALTFSGGVADHIYRIDEDDIFRYGDIGILLGRSIRASRLMKEKEVIKGKETIRATVVGAGTHTTEISGSTISYAEEILPIKNLPILKIPIEEEVKGAKAFKESLLTQIQWYKTEGEVNAVGVAFTGSKKISFEGVEALADAIIQGFAELRSRGLPIICIIENDIAKVMGQTINRKLSHKEKVICIDSIKVEHGDYIDIGRPMAEGSVVPVVVKTLIFNS